MQLKKVMQLILPWLASKIGLSSTHSENKNNYNIKHEQPFKVVSHKSKCVLYQKEKTLPEVSYDGLDVNRLTAKVCMKELSLIQPFIDFKGYYDVTKQ